ncbi:Uncharacterised protein [Porphyromonas macacae]|uniref:Outer membrane protein beta-barrel domain-containing protein n=2 Tax=Porphyromonas macacae TaxID=28115 RepID=A0A379E7T6_9PORP|nr:Uncharacterised protein [Porphyromonas macacae]
MEITMKRILSVVAFALCTMGPVKAQKVAFRAEGGASFNDVKVTVAGRHVGDTKMHTGFRAGVSAEFYFGDGFYFAPGLNIKRNGTTVEDKSMQNLAKELQKIMQKLPIPLPPEVGKYLDGLLKQKAQPDLNMKMLYLQIPLHVGFHTALGHHWHYSLEGGPYVAYGIGGKIRQAEKELDTFDKDNGFNRFEWGVGASLAVGYGPVYVRLGGELGLKKLKTTLLNNDIYGYNRDFYTTLGVRF